VECFLARTSHRDQRQVAAVLIYIAWNLYKERNRRIFERISLTRVLQLIKEEMKLRKDACGVLELFSFYNVIVFVEQSPFVFM
jgi:hypothetical protein